VPGIVLCFIAAATIAAAQGTASKPDGEFLRKLSAAAVERTHHSARYVSDYVHIPYLGGDVPANTGVCTDEVIRSYRALGIDPQKEVHEDMARNFDAYPHRWQRRPDSSIDHRRVESDGLLRAEGMRLPITSVRRTTHRGTLWLGTWARRYPHRNCCGRERTQRALHGCA
jgi:uncharacterized protein YijF (DUF1287 family)